MFKKERKVEQNCRKMSFVCCEKVFFFKENAIKCALFFASDHSHLSSYFSSFFCAKCDFEQPHKQCLWSGIQLRSFISSFLFYRWLFEHLECYDQLVSEKSFV